MEGMMRMKKGLLVIFTMLFPFFLLSAAIAETDVKTPKESEIIGYLRQGLAVFLCFHNPAEPNLDKIKADIELVVANFKGAIEDVYVSGDDKKEDKLRENFKVSPKDTAVFIIFPSGAAVAKLEGADITKENLMKVLFTARGRCCGGGSKKTCK